MYLILATIYVLKKNSLKVIQCETFKFMKKNLIRKEKYDKIPTKNFVRTLNLDK